MEQINTNKEHSLFSIKNYSDKMLLLAIIIIAVEPDSNNDGIISNLDENFDKLQIWQDSNSNGVSETNELKSLSELGIKSLNLRVQYRRY